MSQSNTGSRSGGCFILTRTGPAVRIVRHRGHKKVVIAVAHAMLIAAYHLLARQTMYHEFSGDYYDRRHAERTSRRAVQILEHQGYRVA